MRKLFILLIALSILPLLFCCKGKVSDKEENSIKPNIIFILTDDQRWDAFGFAGNDIIQTPNMQAPYGYMTRYHDITHEFGVDERSLGQLLNAAGLNNFRCYKLESFIGYSPQVILRKIARRIYQFTTRVLRYINGMLNPKILSSRFFAVIENSPKTK